MSDYTKYYKKWIEKTGQPIYQTVYPSRLTTSFKSYNLSLIEKGKVKSFYRKDNTKDKYAYNPTTRRAVRLIKNKDGTFKYKYMKNFRRLQNDNIVYEPNEEIVQRENVSGFLGDMEKIIREAGIINKGEYRMILYVNGDDKLDISSIQFQTDWTSSPTRLNFYAGGVSSMEDLLWKSGDDLRVVFTKYQNLSRRFVKQLYADGVKNCLIEPIRLDLMSRYENSTSKTYKKKIESSITYLDEISEYYPDGIPLEEISKIGDKLKTTIEIYSPFCRSPYFSHIHKNSAYNYKFYNTRLNHLELSRTYDLDNLFNANKYVEVSQKEMNEIYNYAKKNDKKFIYKRNKKNITQLNTEQEIYIVKDPFNNTFNNWLEETNLKWDDTDCLKNSDLQSFIDYGTHYLLTHDFIKTENIKDLSDIEHIDRAKAYFTYHKNKYYNGIMTKITDFRRVDNFNKVGFYYIDNVNLEDAIPQFKRINKQLRLFISNNIYSSHILSFFKDLGCKFNVLYGCYGIEHDIRFNEEFKKKDNDNISGYAKATGIFSSLKKYNEFYSNMDLEHAELIRQETDNIYYDTYNKNAIFRIDKQSVRNRKYITGQIVGFLLIDMIEQLIKMDFKKLIRLCVDGIYYYKHDYDNRNNILNGEDSKWSKKDKMTFNNKIDADNTYIMNICEKKVNYLFLPHKTQKREWFKSELFKGAGGTGKTYFNLMDKGLIDLVYVAPSYKLCSAVQNEYGCETTTHYHLLNEPYAKEQGYLYKWSVYIIDECSMLTNGTKEYLLNNIRGKIIFLGDLGFQLPPIVSNKENLIEMNEKGFENVIEYYNVRRFKCDKLKSLARKLRFCISKNLNINFKKACGIQTITREELKNMYKKEDMILCSEHYVNDYYSEMFKDLKKYKVKVNKGEYHNGDIIFKDEDIKKEFRHGYTTHSIQGENFKTNNIYIDTLSFKSLRMFYTAISRASYINQLYIIDSLDDDKVISFKTSLKKKVNNTK